MLNTKLKRVHILFHFRAVFVLSSFSARFKAAAKSGVLVCGRMVRSHPGPPFVASKQFYIMAIIKGTFRHQLYASA